MIAGKMQIYTFHWSGNDIKIKNRVLNKKNPKKYICELKIVKNRKKCESP